MADTKKNTPEEIPLHEVVLSVIYEVNKERPVELSATDVFYKMSDPTLTERQITQVLDWLVNEKRLEKFTDKYSLDRFEFLDQRSKEEGPYIPKKDESGQPLPLHEVILDAMYQAGMNSPVELTASDIFWKISDPAVRESQITEVLDWLVTQKRVDQFAGKYAMTSLEFLSQKSAKGEEPKKEKKTVKPKKPATPKPKKTEKPVVKKPVAKKPVEDSKKIAEKPKKEKAPEVKVTKKENAQTTPTPKKSTPKKPVVEQKKTPVEVKPKQEKLQEVSVPASSPQSPKGNSNLVAILTTAAAVIVVYSIYLVFTIESNKALSEDLQKVQSEMTMAQKELAELSKEADGSESVELKLELMEDMLAMSSVQANTLQEKMDQSTRNNSVLFRLVVSSFLLILLLGGLIFVKTRKE